MKGNTKAYLALLFVCIVWGTTYLGIRVAVASYPTFLFVAVRQLSAGIVILLMALLMNRRTDLSRRNVLNQVFIGFLMITLGNGIVSWSEQYVSSGVAALICSMMPIAAVVINLSSSREERLNLPILAGLLLGFSGVALIFKNNLNELTNPDYLAGIGGLLLATSSWALGSILNKRRPPRVNPMFNSGLQVISGGLFSLLLSPLTDDYSRANYTDTAALQALLYLIVFGSVLAYTAYMYALKELPVGLVSIYAYVNPLVAVIVGSYWDEPITVWTGASFVTILAGVFLVNQGYKKQKMKKTIQQIALAER